MTFLVGVAASVEQILTKNNDCYVFALLEDAKNISLKIVKNGLKGEITKGTQEITELYEKHA